MSVGLALFVLLFLPLAAAAGEIDEASSHNIGIATLLLGAENACGFEGRQPSADDVFSVADITAVAMVPQAENATSDLSEPKLLWSWSADYPEDAVFPVESDNGCPEGRIEIRSPTNRKLKDGKLVHSYGNRTVQANLFSNGPNPIQLDLNPDYLRMEDYAGLFANLTVNLSGKVSVAYSYEKYWYAYSCETDGEYVGCGCTLQRESGVKEYEKPVFGSRKFLVETGPVEKFWLNPPLGKRLAGKQDGKLLFFARRMPAKIVVKADGGEIAGVVPYKFRLEDGKCSEKRVGMEFSPQAQNAFVNAGNTSEFPRQLVEKDAAYLPIYLEFGWDADAGRKNITTEYEDWFSHKMNFSDEIFAREPEAFGWRGRAESGEAREQAEGAAGAMVLRQGDEARTPAAYPAKENAFTTVSLSSLAAVFAIPFALGAIAIIRHLRKFGA